jgi:predicted tellurium resistance membrane protein TerC
LLAISWVMKLTTPLIHLGARPITGRDLILLVGGIFLIGKSTHEIYDKVETHGSDEGKGKGRSFFLTLVQIIVLDVVFSLDSVITAVGMVDAVEIMIVAMLFAVGVMLLFAGRIGEFVNEHPSMKILALSFLIMIGAMLVAEGLGQHISKATIYTAMAFSLVVELLNMRFRKKAKVAAPSSPKLDGSSSSP